MKIKFPPVGRCVYPTGDLPRLKFCGKPVMELGKPYCLKCARKAYTRLIVSAPVRSSSSPS